MSDYDSDVFTALKTSFDGVTMETPAARIELAGRTLQRRRRHRLAGMTAAGMAVAAVAVGIPLYSSSSTAPRVQVRPAAYTVETQTDGTVRASWDKKRYFEDHEGLQAALRKAGFPVLIKEGKFCRGPQDDATLDPSGVGPGVPSVMRGVRGDDGRVTFIFTPSAVPPGKQLFIGFLNRSQLAAVHGNPGSVERLVPTGTSLVCTTDAPPAHER
ncbi:hypothetical protein [Cryptosporangium phraense]|uniref:Uncharacterized protein n=1 Tax=Cryptosporangium phraense TaxID=2593070 RepID=A0A545AVH0_9ACTN|nr:hypothetical protein [Cryptosporangium phraense]TQS45320.1 hypothetical protein FL583_09495 [Cryptosporangium phraense]